MRKPPANSFCSFLPFSHFKILILITALLLPTGAFPATSSTQKLGPAEAIPRIDELCSMWLATAQVAQMPTLSNFHDMAVCSPDLLGVNYLPGSPFFTGSGPRWQRFRTLPLLMMSVDGQPCGVDNSRWYPYQVLRNKIIGKLEIETAVRMVFEGQALMYHIDLRNRAHEDVTSEVAVSSEYNETAFTRQQEPVITCHDGISGLSSAWAFVQTPEKIEPIGNMVTVHWSVKVRALGSAQVDFVVAADPDPAQAGVAALRYSRAFTEFWNQTRLRWAERWRQAFTPGNAHFSGNVPVLETGDYRLKEIYYRSILTLLTSERTNLPRCDRVFVSGSARAPAQVALWETSLWSTVFALLEPRGLERQIQLIMESNGGRLFAEARAFDLATGQLTGPGFAGADYAMFRLIWGLMGSGTGGSPMIQNTGETPVPQFVEALKRCALAWRKLPRQGTLADYGGSRGLLECVAPYAHYVPALNAGNVWMMRSLAAVLDPADPLAVELRADADRTAAAVRQLYAPGKGYWCCLDAAGRRIEVRDAWDFASLGTAMAGDLPAETKKQMLAFIVRELATINWMRALSLEDAAAERSDRPDNGPMGAADFWPALSAGAMCELGAWDKGLSFLRHMHAVVAEGIFSQAHELYGPNALSASAPARSAGRQGMMPVTTAGGAFAETIVSTFFGYRPQPRRLSSAAPQNPESLLFAPNIPRGFEGRLIHVRHGKDYYTITSGAKGLEIKKE